MRVDAVINILIIMLLYEIRYEFKLAHLLFIHELKILKFSSYITPSKKQPQEYFVEVFCSL